MTTGTGDDEYGYWVFLKKQNFDREFWSAEELQAFLKQQSPYVTSDELDQEFGWYEVFLLTSNAKSFRETRDPVCATICLVLSEKFGVYPPRDVVDWLSAGFRQLNRSGYLGDLGKILGIKGGPGQNPIKESFVAARNRYVCDIMSLLISFFDVSAKDAAELVWAREVSGGQWDHIGRFPDSKSLEKLYGSNKPESVSAIDCEFYDPVVGDPAKRRNFADSFSVATADPLLIAKLESNFK